MRILRVNMNRLSVSLEDLPEDWKLIGGRGLIGKILNAEVPCGVDPLGQENKLIISGGALAGTLAPQLGRVSVGAKSPLTLGIKEANAGGPAAQKLDRLGIRAIVLEGASQDGKFYLLNISKEGTQLLPADQCSGMKNYALVEALQKKHGARSAFISIGPAGERKHKSASVSLTDVFGDPSRNAGRGGLGAVMGSKGIKAIIIDDRGAGPVEMAHEQSFKRAVREWVEILKRDISCALFSTFGTPLAVAPNSCQGTMPTNNYRGGRPEGFRKLSGEAIKRIVWERGGKYHGCMPGCVVQCSILFKDAEGKRLASAYEYEAIAMLGTNLGIDDHDAIGMLKYLCDDLGLDLIETGSSLGVAAEAGRMNMGEFRSALELLLEIEKGTPFGRVLGDGVVSTGKYLGVERIPAIRGQAIPGHDPRTVKGIGVTYATSPMGADHTAGLIYRDPLRKEGQIENSLRAQVKAAVCDTFGYCLNALPAGKASLYKFLRDLVNARYGLALSEQDIIEIGKQTLREELHFNRDTESRSSLSRAPEFVRTEKLNPADTTFDVADSDLIRLWEGLDRFGEPEKIWETRFPALPRILFGAGVFNRLGQALSSLRMERALLIADPIMKELGYADQVRENLKRFHMDCILFAEVEPDPPIGEIERIALLYKEHQCDGLVALGGGSSMDAAKATAIRVSQSGILEEYGSLVGGAGKIKPPLPPVVCIPTTSGTGSEVNSYSVITDEKTSHKFVIMSDFLVPKLALIDPLLTKTMPPGLTSVTGVDALAHCVEGYVGMAIPYHPYYEALALYGTKLIGRSLRKAFSKGEDMDARSDMCMAALYGGTCFTKGLGLGHAIGHVLGGLYHIPHGKAVGVSLLCFVKAYEQVCKKEFSDLAWALDGSSDLLAALIRLYRDLEMPLRFRELGIPEAELKYIAFEASMDVPNMLGNPVPPKKGQILELLKDFY